MTGKRGDKSLPPWITEAQFAVLLGWKTQTLVKQRQRGVPPGSLATRQGRNIRYPTNVVLGYFREIGGEQYVLAIIDELSHLNG